LKFIQNIISSAFSSKNSSAKFNKSNGPLSDIILSPEHGGPVLCMDATQDVVITGSTDHGLRVYNMQTGKQIKELFSKNYGHTEWVTCVKILKNKKVISGGMDSNICIWEATGVSCKYITENTGSISKIMVNETEKILLSGSYDSSVRLFDISSLQCLTTLSGVHKGPVSEVDWKNSLCVSGSKDGSVAIWDLNAEKCVKQAKLHGGLVKNIKLFYGNNDQFDNLIITGGSNDGMINCLDMRTNNPVFSKQVIK
jgi:WD40 repeat protein